MARASQGRAAEANGSTCRKHALTQALTGKVLPRAALRKPLKAYSGCRIDKGADALVRALKPPAHRGMRVLTRIAV